MRGKYSKYWRSIQKRYASKQKVKKQQEQQRQSLEGNGDKDKEKQTPEKKKRKIDDFQALFTNVSNIMHELWLERNTDRHNPAKGQLRIAKITEATRVVEH